MRCRQTIRTLPVVLALCATAVLLAACASSQRPPARQVVNQSGYSATFKQGYADGCSSAQSSRRRDEQRYQRDTDYMMGWNDGYGICKRR